MNREEIERLLNLEYSPDQARAYIEQFYAEFEPKDLVLPEEMKTPLIRAVIESYKAISPQTIKE